MMMEMNKCIEIRINYVLFIEEVNCKSCMRKKTIKIFASNFEQRFSIVVSFEIQSKIP